MPVIARRITATALHEINVRTLKRNGLLMPNARGAVSKSFAGRLMCEAVVTMQGDGAGVLIEADGRAVVVDIVHTAQPFGGRRAWFACSNCLRRAAILYPFACRRCCGIVYPSQREAPHHRAIRRAQRLRIRLGGSCNLTEPLPPRPWGMWDRTYRQRIAACVSAETRSISTMSAVLQRWHDASARSAK